MQVKVRPWRIFFFGGPRGLSALLKFQTALTRLHFENFANLKLIFETKSTMPNVMAILKMREKDKFPPKFIID